MSKINPPGNLFKFTKVKEGKILKILRNLQATKAAGIDNVPPRMIMDATEELCKPLCYLVNCSLQTSLFPTAEKSGKTAPIFKLGDPANLDSYRPITVIPILSEALEKFIFNQLSSYHESNKLFCPHQFGFRQGRSTQHAVALLTDEIRQSIDKGLVWCISTYARLVTLSVT